MQTRWPGAASLKGKEWSLHRAVRGGMGSPGVLARMPQELRQALRELVRDRVLESLGLPCTSPQEYPRCSSRKVFDQAVPPYQPQSLLMAPLSERNPR